MDAPAPAPTVLIVLPSIVSAIGLAFILAGILVDQRVVRDVFLCIGVSLLWTDFFITMAIFRATVRDINGRLKRIEERGSDS